MEASAYAKTVVYQLIHGSSTEIWAGTQSSIAWWIKALHIDWLHQMLMSRKFGFDQLVGPKVGL
jgi:hypothetical protein